MAVVEGTLPGFSESVAVSFLVAALYEALSLMLHPAWVSVFWGWSVRELPGGCYGGLVLARKRHTRKYHSR